MSENNENTKERELVSTGDAFFSLFQNGKNSTVSGFKSFNKKVEQGERWVSKKVFKQDKEFDELIEDGWKSLVVKLKDNKDKRELQKLVKEMSTEELAKLLKGDKDE